MPLPYIISSQYVTERSTSLKTYGLHLNSLVTENTWRIKIVNFTTPHCIELHLAEPYYITLHWARLFHFTSLPVTLIQSRLHWYRAHASLSSATRENLVQQPNPS